MKKAFILVSLFVLLTVVYAASIQAEKKESFSKDGFTYEYMRDGNLKLINYEYKEQESILNIPDAIDNHHIECIGAYAFDGCRMKQITIPDTVRIIEAFAFNDCQRIEKITIPIEVHYIDGNPFTGCTNLVNISVDPIHPTLRVTSDGVLYNLITKTILCYPCTKPELKYTIHEGTLKIGIGAFFGCNSLISVIIPDTVTEIGGSAFFGCKYMENISLPESLLIMDELAFAGCSSLSSVRIPSRISRIEKSTFFNCLWLSDVQLPDNLTVINDRAFYGCKKLNEIYVPVNVNTIGEQAFYGCKELKKAFVPATTTKIGDAAFDDCSAQLHLYIDNYSYAWIYATIYDLSKAYNYSGDTRNLFLKDE